MRIYNGKNSQIDVPLFKDTRIVVPGHSVSKDFLPNDNFMALILQCYTRDEIALIVSSAFELSICARFSAAPDMCVQSLDDALERFGLKPEPEPEPEPTPAEVIEEIPTPEVVVLEVKEEEKKEEVKEEVKEEAKEAPVVEKKKKKRSTKKKTE